MPKGPPVHEIFSHPGKSTPFHYDKKESKTQSHLTPKKSLAPLPPMKKFGGYKPKILGNNDDIIPVHHSKPQSPEPPVETRRPTSSAFTFTTPAPKPFVIGDKNTPMILSTVDRDGEDSDTYSADLHNGIDEVHIYEEPPMYMSGGVGDTHHMEMNNNNLNNNNNIMSSNIGGMPYNNNNNNKYTHDFEHSLSSDNGAFTVTNDKDDLINENDTRYDPTTFATENPVFNTTSETIDTRNADDSRVEKGSESEPEGVFIPAPDYGEEEQTMEFDEEDPDDMDEEARRAQILKQQRLQRLKEQQQSGTGMKVYAGEDLSKYLSDDEDEVNIENVNSTRTIPTRLNQKHSLFKTNPHNTTGKRKTYNKKQAPKFNSVRNFSFADSKYATSGKASGKKMAGSTGEYESFLSTSQQGEGYETFLNSKHGVVGPETTPPGGHVGRRPQYNNGKSGDGIWKKLTVRLKHKLQNKNGYDMEEQF